jgi:hypothetical protein
VPKQFPVLSENEMKQTRMLQCILSDMRYEFDLSTSINLVSPFMPILFSVLSENEVNSKYVTTQAE